MRHNSNRPYSEELLLKIKEQNEKIIEQNKAALTYLGQIQIQLNENNTRLDLLQNLDWLQGQLEEQGKIPKKAP